MGRGEDMVFRGATLCYLKYPVHKKNYQIGKETGKYIPHAENGNKNSW